MLSLPDSPTSLRLADWLELKAVTSPDGDSSDGDLESALRLASYARLADDEAIQRRIQEVFAELERRQRWTNRGYPFEIDFPPVVRLKGEWEKFPAYTFCLCLSAFTSPDPVRTGKLFEKVSCHAIERYLQGDAEVVGFGFPRDDFPAAFNEAVEHLCQLLGEGVGFSGNPMLRRRDDNVDLVAWRHFFDKRPGKILVFGQCASGWNWNDKLGELNPQAFCAHWMQHLPSSPVVRAFFVPHDIERDEWSYTVLYAGIVFDRCRIAYWAQDKSLDYDQHIEWVRECLRQVVL